MAAQSHLLSTNLPEFRSPPVVEVALSVSFEPLAGYTSAHTGIYWNRVSERFSRAEEHPPYKIPAEEEVAAAAAKGLELRLSKEPEPRIWLLSDDQSELIQIQKDGFFRNWRKRSGQEEYPRFGALRKRFEMEFEDFSNFVEQAGIGRVVPNRCEVTYVNQILAGSAWQRFGEIDRVLSGCSSLGKAEFLPVAEQASWSAKFAIRDRHERFLGRLTAEASPAFRREDRHPLIHFVVTARGRPIGEGLPGVLGFFDVGHEWIVRGFADLTTPEMHSIWGRTR